MQPQAKTDNTIFKSLSSKAAWSILCFSLMDISIRGTPIPSLFWMPLLLTAWQAELCLWSPEDASGHQQRCPFHCDQHWETQCRLFLQLWHVIETQRYHKKWWQQLHVSQKSRGILVKNGQSVFSALMNTRHSGSRADPPLFCHVTDDKEHDPLSASRSSNLQQVSYILIFPNCFRTWFEI